MDPFPVLWAENDWESRWAPGSLGMTRAPPPSFNFPSLVATLGCLPMGLSGFRRLLLLAWYQAGGVGSVSMPGTLGGRRAAAPAGAGPQGMQAPPGALLARCLAWATLLPAH